MIDMYNLIPGNILMLSVNRSQKIMQSYTSSLFGTHAISIRPDPETSGMFLVYRYSSIMDGKEFATLTGNGSPYATIPGNIGIR